MTLSCKRPIGPLAIFGFLLPLYHDKCLTKHYKPCQQELQALECRNALHMMQREYITWYLFELLRPCPDLVPVPGHCALALKGMTFRHCGALSFVSICCSVAILSPPQLQITGKHG